MQLKLIPAAAAVIAAAALSACQTDSPIDDLLEGRKIDYEAEDTQQHRSLQYPPDLLSGAVNAIDGTVSLSEYTIQSVPVIDPQQQEVAPQTLPEAKVHYRRSGNLRWIQADLPPNDAWLITRDFWTDHLGFGLEKENIALGIMETDWLDLRERVETPGWLGAYVDGVLNRINDSGQRDKFIIQLEKNDSNGTDIFLAHRYIVARYSSEGIFQAYEKQPSDLQLEIELMRRLMLHFSRQSQDAAALSDQIADAEAEDASPYSHQNTTLHIQKPFYESWQIVQVGLNRGGFSIEDRDYQQGIIYIRHSGGPETDKIFGKAETNFFNRLFGEQRPIFRDIKLIFNHEGGDSVRLTAEAPEDDDPLTEIQSSVVLELLHEHLP